ncbi:MAG: NAD-binding protein [Anaerolineae bacterium]|nr:NAD-binding protein [Anaerolineae bacterium]
MTTNSTVGFIGLGAMGLAMAKVLVRQGFDVRGYDLNPQSLRAFGEAGGRVAESAQAAAQGADVLYLMVVNAAQVQDVLFGAGSAVTDLPQGAVVIVGSTIMPADARAISTRLHALGYDMIDAPVSGGVVRATDGTLTIMASGSTAAFEKAAQVLDAVSANLFNLGQEVGQGSTVKVINQLLCGVHIAAAAEAIGLGVRAGVDSATLYEVIRKSAGNSWMFENRVPHMLENDYSPLSAVDIFVKDLGIVLDTGHENRFPLPLAAAAHQVFMMASAAGLGREDDAAVVKIYEQLTGIDVTSSQFKAP